MRKIMLLTAMLFISIAVMCQTKKAPAKESKTDSTKVQPPKKEPLPDFVLTITMPASKWDGVADIIEKTHVDAQQYKEAMKVVEELRRQYLLAMKANEIKKQQNAKDSVQSTEQVKTDKTNK